MTVEQTPSLSPTPDWIPPFDDDDDDDDDLDGICVNTANDDCCS